MSGGDPAVSVAKRFAETFPVVAEEDRWALEQQQRMFDYPDDEQFELFLKPDRALRRARKVFLDMLRAEQTAPGLRRPVVAPTMR